MGRTTRRLGDHGFTGLLGAPVSVTFINFNISYFIHNKYAFQSKADVPPSDVCIFSYARVGGVYNDGLRAEPPAGSRGRAPGQEAGANAPGAERLFALSQPE